MKIILAKDGSKCSKLVINEITNRPFPPKTELCIVSFYERILLKNTLEQMEVSHK